MSVTSLGPRPPPRVGSETRVETTSERHTGVRPVTGETRSQRCRHVYPCNGGRDGWSVPTTLLNYSTTYTL